MKIDGLPVLTWTHGESVAAVNADHGALTLTAAAGVDWSNDALTGGGQHGATLLGFRPDGDFALSARVEVHHPRTTFDAGVLGLWIDNDHWAKLCFEYSPAGDPMVVSVVTNGFSDDCNSTLVEAPHVYLRLARIGNAYAFHSSPDGEHWDLVRLFRMDSDATPLVGFMSQAPMGETCEATFDRILLTATPPADLRDGS